MKALKIFIVLAAIVALVIALWYFASPLVTNRTVNEELPSDLVGMENEPDVVVDEEMMDITTMTDDPVVEQQVLLSGMFRDADNFHRGSGKAEIHVFSTGDQILRLEDFEVTNGPDLHVLLARNGEPTSRDDLGEYIDLGSLKGNKGNQNYEIPANIDVNDFNSVVIYCKPFHVVFATARLN